MDRDYGINRKQEGAATEWMSQLKSMLNDIRRVEIDRFDEHVRRLEEARIDTLRDSDALIAVMKDRRKDAERRLQAKPKSVRRSAKAFRISGKVLLGKTETPLPGLRFRIVDPSGQVVEENPEWVTDASGRFYLEATSKEIDESVELALEIIDPEGDVVKRVKEVPQIALGETSKLELTVPVGKSRMIDLLSVHGQHKLDIDFRQHDKLIEDLDALEAEREMIVMAFDRALYSSRKIRDGLEKGIHLPILIDGSWIEKPRSKRLVLHVTHEKSSNTWRILKAGVKEPLHTLRTKKEAVLEARKLAKANMPSQVKIHKRDGKIQEERTYGDDPKRSVG